MVVLGKVVFLPSLIFSPRFRLQLLFITAKAILLYIWSSSNSFLFGEYLKNCEYPRYFLYEIQLLSHHISLFKRLFSTTFFSGVLSFELFISRRVFSTIFRLSASCLYHVIIFLKCMFTGVMATVSGC